MRIEEYDHQKLLTDKNRNNWFWNKISKVAKNKVVLDIGTGSGILGMMAIASGAKKVFMIDHNPYCIELTTYNLFKNNICNKKYSVLLSEFNEIILNLNPDIIISEMISPNLFGEPFNLFCEIIKDSIYNPIIIPEFLSASLVIVDSFSTKTKSFFDSFSNENNYKFIVKTGVEEFDNLYKMSYQLPIEYNHNRLDPSQYNVDLRRNFIKNNRCIIKNAITYDAYNPNRELSWNIETKIPNREYIIMLDTFLGRDDLRLSMGYASWATHFYKFEKTSDNINIKFDHDKKDFIFSCS